jgi:GT2 family glycosyltransferase
MPSIVVVILNWNGAADTIACLDSISRQTSRDVQVLVVDNGSEDDSTDRIKGWATDHHLAIELIENGANLGFAAGSNVGIRHALTAGADHVLLLNNDTVLAPDAVEILTRFLDQKPDFAAVTGQIRYADRPVIWNCGGNLTWFGSRRYLFSEQPASAAPQSGWRRITFITGCATLVRASVFEQMGLLTERFFFGEEDYEFSLRMQRARRSMACCFDAVIQHKVGSSIDRVAPTGAIGRYYIYYLNRFIDMRDYYPRPFWWLWRVATLAFVLPRLRISQKLGWRSLALLGRRLLSDSTTLPGVSRERFETATRSGLESL